jgi:hypothetical protein
MLAILGLIGAGVLVAIAPLLLTPLIDRHRRRALRRIVPGVCAVLNAHGIDYWADFGTLLGFRRERDIILSDKDADLGVLRDEKPKILALGGELARAGFALTDRGGRSQRVLRVRDRRTGYHLDIYTYVLDGGVLRSDMMRSEDIPAALVNDRVAAAFLGGSIVVPRDVDAILRHRYGDAFHVPRRGDKGATRPYSAIRSLLEDVEAGWIGIVSWLRASVG